MLMTMTSLTLQDKMFGELREKKIFDLARSYAYNYVDQIRQMDVFPAAEKLADLSIFDEELPEVTCDARKVIAQLNTYGAPATPAQTGGRYFGFVNGGVLPVALATKWMTDFWDQCAGLYLTSPINAKLEEVCEKWLVELFKLPASTVAGFVSGTSLANLCGLGAARYRLLKNQGWDINQQGLQGSPELKIIAHKGIHGSIIKALVILGFGRENVLWVDADNQGRIIAEAVPELDDQTLLILQAGNVNTGAFDPFNIICQKARDTGAWVHIDGAFGLWAQVSSTLSHLTDGLEHASSWAVDGHKTLNTPYDSGVILCRDKDALIRAMQATGDYLMMADRREPLLYTPEMSKRARAFELWAVLKYLGKEGVDELVTSLHQKAVSLSDKLKARNFRIHNEVVFNQVLVSFDNPNQTNEALSRIQQSGECWCGGTTWNDEPAIRISICSWATTEQDIDRTVNLFQEIRKSIADR
jgi:glutamate/tyrosine decarboxylase-like PLP-dependent enzyme